MKKLTRFFAISFLVATFSQNLFAADTTSSNTSSTTTAATTDSTTASDTASSSTTSTSTAPAKKVISTSNILQQLQKAGYIVKSIDFDKDSNQYSVDAVDKHGDKQSLTIDATQGLAADQKKTPHEAPLSQIVKKYEKNGSYVKSVAFDNNTYKIVVIDNKNNEQDLTIDPVTGKSAQS